MKVYIARDVTEEGAPRREHLIIATQSVKDLVCWLDSVGEATDYEVKEIREFVLQSEWRDEAIEDLDEGEEPEPFMMFRDEDGMIHHAAESSGKWTAVTRLMEIAQLNSVLDAMVGPRT